MTDTFNPPSETLPSRGAEIGVTTDGPISEARVIYDGELVYGTVNGVTGFQPAYAGSSIAGDKKSMTVRRLNAWPKPFDLHIDDAVVSTPTGWDVLLDADFTSYPNGTLVSSGAVADVTETLGGVVWKSHWCGNGSGSIVSQGQINGSGYRLSSRAASGHGDAFIGAYLCTDHTALAGYVAGRKSCVLAVVDGAQNIGTQTRVLVGHFKPIIGATSGNPTITANSGICGGYYPRTSDSNVAGILSAQNAHDKPAEATGASTNMYQAARPLDTTQSVFGAIRVSDSHGQALFGAYDGSTRPVVENLDSAGSVDVVAYSSGGLYAGVLWGTDFGPGSGYQCLVKRIVILQQKA